MPSALDHIITHGKDPAPETSTLSDAISDHQPIVMTARLPRLRRPAQCRVLRNWRRVDWSAICLELLLTDWTQVDDAVEVDSCVEHFMAIWNAVVGRHCPPRRVRVSRPSCPWLEDPDLRAVMAERDCARDTWLCLRTPEAKKDFTELRNRVKSQLIVARRQYLCGDLTLGCRGGFWPTFKRSPRSRLAVLDLRTLRRQMHSTATSLTSDFASPLTCRGGGGASSRAARTSVHRRSARLIPSSHQ